MAEAEQQQKITGLSEQWLLVEKDELDDHNSNSTEQRTEDVVAKKIDEAPPTGENAPTSKLEADLTKVEENPKENSVTTIEHKAEPSQEVEEKHESLETASTAEENGANQDDTPETQVEEQEEKDETEKETPTIKLETAPADFRFPTTNQTRHCFTRYIEYHRCINAKGEGAPECQKFAKYYRSLCPGEWVERWNEQRETGTFPGPL